MVSRAIIAGGGIGGIPAAIALCKAGFDVKVRRHGVHELHGLGLVPGLGNSAGLGICVVRVLSTASNYNAGTKLTACTVRPECIAAWQ